MHLSVRMPARPRAAVPKTGAATPRWLAIARPALQWLGISSPSAEPPPTVPSAKVTDPPLTPAVQRRASADEPPPAPRTRRDAPWLLGLLALCAIVALALGLRLVKLTGSPYGFFCDEASNALDAYWIGHTLHDQHGAFLPAYFQALSDWRGGFHIYWEVPFIALFGLSEFAARFSSTVAGTLTVLLTYLFVSKAINRPVGLLSAFLLAIAPWHILHSRVGWEVISVPFATALCLTFLYYGLERPRLLPLAFLFGALGVYTYQPGRVFFPLFCLAVLVIYARPLWRRRRASVIGLAVAIIVLIPTVLSVLDGTFFTRLNQLSSGPPQSFAQHLTTFWMNYEAHFEPAFLFQSSTSWLLRHYVQGFGMMYPIEAPFLVIGVAVIIARLRRVEILLLVWFAIYPIAAALVDQPVSTRSITGVIVFQIAIGLGVYTAIQGVLWLARRLAAPRRARVALGAALVALFLAANVKATSDFMNAYLNQYPRYSSGFYGWQWGAQQIVSYFEAHRRDYARQLIDAEFNAPDELVTFYSTPNHGQCAGCAVTNVLDPTSVQQYYSPTLREVWAVGPTILTQSALQHIPHRIVGQLHYPDGSVAFLFVATGPSMAQTARTSEST